MNAKAVFTLITKEDYKLVSKALELIEKHDKRVTNTLIRNRKVSDLRKCIIKKSIDFSPKGDFKHLSKVFDCSVPAIREAYKQSNILYSNDEEFINLYNSIE